MENKEKLFVQEAEKINELVLQSKNIHASLIIAGFKDVDTKRAGAAGIMNGKYNLLCESLYKTMVFQEDIANVVLAVCARYMNEYKTKKAGD